VATLAFLNLVLGNTTVGSGNPILVADVEVEALAEAVGMLVDAGDELVPAI
jgi:hypothetical protein